MELLLAQKFVDNKSFANPVNPDEVFSCHDLVLDYHACRKDRKYAEADKSIRVKRCFDYRSLAIKCYLYDEDKF